MTLDPNILRDVRVLWGYHTLHHRLKPADLLFIPCSNDLRVADHAAQLFQEGYAPFVLCSGGVAHLDDLLATGWSEPEAIVFARRLEERGVPKNAILVEPKATNSQENVEFSRALLREKNIKVETLIEVCKPYMQRRAYATIKNFWPDVQVISTAPDLTFEEYCSEHNVDDVIHIVVGDTQRMELYPRAGFQIPQDIPDEVWQAYQRLCAAGYTKHLVPEEKVLT